MLLVLLVVGGVGGGVFLYFWRHVKLFFLLNDTQQTQGRT